MNVEPYPIKSETYNVSGVPVDHQDRMAQRMTGMSEQKELLGGVKPLQAFKVCDLPKEDEVDAKTLYIVQQAWMVIDGKWVRLS